MEIPLYQIDAFAGQLFAGNPAAVCPLDRWLDDRQMQAIAMENNLAETAFFVKEDGRYRLRWFTPTVEIDLCGHATLASAFVVFHYLEPASDLVRFETKSGELIVRREGELLSMDFPARPGMHCKTPAALTEALGKTPVETREARDYLAIYESEEDVRSLAPTMDKLARVGHFGIIVTAPARSGADFVSRFFAPAGGINEDPATGSSHCTLVPYWAERLGKARLHALQVSARGGELWCELRGDRVVMAGKAVRFLEGKMFL